MKDSLLNQWLEVSTCNWYIIESLIRINGEDEVVLIADTNNTTGEVQCVEPPMVCFIHVHHL